MYVLYREQSEQQPHPSEPSSRPSFSHHLHHLCPLTLRVWKALMRRKPRFCSVTHPIAFSHSHARQPIAFRRWSAGEGLLIMSGVQGVGQSDDVCMCACLLLLDLRSMKDAVLLWTQGDIYASAGLEGSAAARWRGTMMLFIHSGEQCRALLEFVLIGKWQLSEHGSLDHATLQGSITATVRLKDIWRDLMTFFGNQCPNTEPNAASFCFFNSNLVSRFLCAVLKWNTGRWCKEMQEVKTTILGKSVCLRCGGTSLILWKPICGPHYATLLSSLAIWLVWVKREQRTSVQILSVSPCKYNMVLHDWAELFRSETKYRKEDILSYAALSLLYLAVKHRSILRAASQQLHKELFLTCRLTNKCVGLMSSHCFSCKDFGFTREMKAVEMIRGDRGTPFSKSKPNLSSCCQYKIPNPNPFDYIVLSWNSLEI